MYTVEYRDDDLAIMVISNQEAGSKFSLSWEIADYEPIFKEGEFHICFRKDGMMLVVCVHAARNDNGITLEDINRVAEYVKELVEF